MYHLSSEYEYPTSFIFLLPTPVLSSKNISRRQKFVYGFLKSGLYIVSLVSYYIITTLDSTLCHA